jgi:putative endopeptidase
MRPLWRRVINTVDGTIGDALGQLYVAEYFPPQAKKSIDTLVKNITLACEERIKNLEWMTPATKKKAIQKLNTLRYKVGYPNKWLSYKGLSITPEDFFGNVIRANRYEHTRVIKKIGKKPDLDEWFMTPSTVNAYFNANLNEIVFPAGILQSPFFDANADDAVNYGGIGAVIGHEITHAFDDEGRKYDHQGNLKDWWVKKDEIEFKKRAEVLRKQYDAFEVLPGHHVNGELTLGENIADLGGVLIAYDAWKKSQKGKKSVKIGGFTPEQRFFLGNAMGECGVIRDEALKKRLVVDPHSPSICRTNGPMANVPAFYEAFDVKEGDKLFIPTNKQAHIW